VKSKCGGCEIEVKRLKELHSFNRKFVPDGPNSQAEERHGYKNGNIKTPSFILQKKGVLIGAVFMLS
jgi:hypothetical protein